jgi:DnaJ homolog subfamily C member 19
MLRIAILLAIGCVLFRWAFGQWPWQGLGQTGGAVRKQALAEARALLGVPAAASREDIIAAHRRLAALVHPDRGGTSDALREANAARDLLLDEMPPPRDGSGGEH